MKPLHHRTLIVITGAAMLFLTACEHNISTGSTVYEDGSFDRTIVLSEVDSSKTFSNIFGVNEESGWKTVIEPAPGPVEENKELEYNITFKKHFNTTADANAEINGDADTLFLIRSSFEKQNRWFFTYIEYSDTYRSLDRLKTVPQEDFFTREDYAFIDRLPAEGSRITKSDSLYLARLNEKIFDLYGARTIFEEMFGDVLATMDEHNVAPSWTDSLIRKKEKVYQQFFKEGSLDDADFLAVADHMKMPLPQEARDAIRKKKKELENRLDFISRAYSGKYLHTITLPWTVVSTNADSAANNALYWKPPVIKFLLSDYTMTARARKMNVWAVALSATLVLSTVALFFFQRGNVQSTDSIR